MNFAKLSFISVFLFALTLNVNAQGVFEGSGEENDDSCVGDGCGVVFPAQENIPAQSTENFGEQSTEVAEVTAPSGDSAAVDSTEKNGTKSSMTEYADDEDEDDARDYYVSESASEYAARKEGFTKLLQFGVRAEGGVSFIFGKKADGWGLGYEAGAGLVGRLPIYRRTLGLQMEFSFSYRQFSYEKDVSYGHNEADLMQMQFKIPVMLQYFIDDDGLYVNLGVNLGLKMAGESTFRATIVDNDDKVNKDKHSNTLPTVGVDVGAVVDLGYMVTSWLAVDLPFIQNFNNLLDGNSIFESTIMGSKLYTLRTTLGLSLYI